MKYSSRGKKRSLIGLVSQSGLAGAPPPALPAHHHYSTHYAPPTAHPAPRVRPLAQALAVCARRSLARARRARWAPRRARSPAAAARCAAARLAPRRSTVGWQLRRLALLPSTHRRHVVGDGPAPTRPARLSSVRLATAPAREPPPRAMPAPGICRARLAHAAAAPAPGVSVAAALARLRASATCGGRCPTTSPTPPARIDPQRPRPGGTPAAGSSCSGTSSAPSASTRPQAWANLAADGAPGGRGVIVAPCSTPASPTPTAAASAARPTSPPTQFVARLRLRRPQPLPQRPQRPRHVRRRHDRRGDQQPLRPHRPRLRRAHDARARARRQGEGDASMIAEGRALRRQPRRARDQPQPRVLHRRHRLGHPRADRSAALRLPPRRRRGRRRRQRGPRARSPTPRARPTSSPSAPPPNTAAWPTTPTTAPASRSSRPAAAPTPTSPATPTATPNCPPAATSTR